MLVSPQASVKKGRNAEQSTGIRLRCPRCFASIGMLQDEDCTPFDCQICRSRMACEQGIWKALLPERGARYARFVQDYESIRASEGRGSSNSDYYLALPYRDLSGLHSSQWAMRARTFRYIEREIVPRIATVAQSRLRILDLGAGNGWMSHRLARLGHTPVAVDLLTNDQDGLGAARHYKQRLTLMFPRFQAELDNLPFSGGQFDLVIFNSSFHYSEDYEKTFGEAIRCSRDRGIVLIADTPWYSDEQSGLQMLEERRALFIKRYGFPSDELKSLEFLTDQRLESLEKRFAIQFRKLEPNYGIRWRMRPLMARLRRKRKPSRFRIYAARIVK
jgi:SAM-dependent methyltransferase